MRVIVAALALWPGVAGAEDWHALSGAEVKAALDARVVQYPGGETQNFYTDGRTLYEAGSAESWGKWRVEGDQYCSQWPPSEHWACYAVALRGLEIRFVGTGGDETIGRYVDLQ